MEGANPPLSLREQRELFEAAGRGDNAAVEEALRREWNRAMEREEAAAGRDLSEVRSEVMRRVRMDAAKASNRRMWLRVAAVLVPLFILGSTALGIMLHGGGESAPMAQIVAPQGELVDFELPDGTCGVLQGGSSMDYAADFAVERRVVLRGTAWFEVARDEQHPFTIECAGNSVKVVGTKFSLSSYPGDPVTELVLEEGRVLFSNDASGRTYEVNASERVVACNGRVSLARVDTSKLTAWREGKLVFRNDSMEEVAYRLGRWYGVEVEIEDRELLSYSYRGVFDNQPLEEVLRMLSLTSPMEYSMVSSASGGQTRIILRKK